MPINQIETTRFGATELRVHVHPGLETCNECEPGLVRKEVPETGIYAKQPGDSDKTRRAAMKEIKAKYGISYDNSKKEGSEAANPQYKDRAQKRRLDKGSSNPYEKTETASVHKQIRKSNKGFKMLANMGWTEGTGLGSGKTGSGRLEPVLVEQRPERAGLGMSEGMIGPVVPKKMREKADLWRKTQERFATTEDLEVPKSKEESGKS